MAQNKLLKLAIPLLIYFLVPATLGQSGENFSQIIQDIIKVDKRVRPVKNPSTVIEITVNFFLMSIMKLDTVEQKLISNGWMEVEWINEYTTWDPSLYNNASAVSPDPETVWRPMLTVQNSMKQMEPVGADFVSILQNFNGTTQWFPGERFETFCRVDVSNFPFDSQRCRWTFFVWGEFWPNGTHLKTKTDSVNLDSYLGNSEWELMSSQAWREEFVVNGEPFVNINYEVTLRRRPTLLALTVLLPVVVLALVSIFVFTVPSESGERLSYSMTSLLSYGVFMSFMLDLMPSSTETLSIVAVNMSCLLVLSAVYVLLCILSLQMFHRDNSKCPVPSALQCVIVWLELLVCLDPPINNKVDNIFHMPTEPLNTSDIGDSIQVKEQEKGIKLKGRLDKWAMARKKKHTAYMDPSEMTWRRVSRTLDKLFFRFFFCVVIISNVVVWGVLITNYYN